MVKPTKSQRLREKIQTDVKYSKQTTLGRRCIVIPKRDFEKLRTYKARPYRLSFQIDEDLEIRQIKKMKNGRQLDIGRYIEGWQLLEET